MDSRDRDVTDRHLAVEALRKSEARYRSLIQGAAYGIYRTTVEGRILDANPAIAAMLGYTVDELMSMDMATLYKSPDERAALVERYQHAHNQTLTADVTWQKKDGTPIIVHLTARLVDFEDGVSCFEGVAEDITEKRALEGQLRQAQKMEAVGRLAARRGARLQQRARRDHRLQRPDRAAPEADGPVLRRDRRRSARRPSAARR